MRKIKRTTKRVRMDVTVSVPIWMPAAHARREVRTLINEQSNYLDHGPEFQDVRVRAIWVRTPTGGRG